LLRFIEEHPLLFSGLGLETEEDIKHSIHLIMCIIAEASGCQDVVLPVQDILGLDASGRMNVPGTALGNWQWRLENFDDLFSTSLPWE
jgi:4-alpha-glucanotransferase